MIKIITVRSNGTRRVQYSFEKPSRTKQSEMESCDINQIMKKFEKTGMVSHVRATQGRYEDVSNVVGYQDALNKVNEAHVMFMTLPAKVRARFENDPGQFLSFASDPKNVDEMRTMGLMVPVKERPVVDVNVVSSSVVERESSGSHDDSDKPSRGKSKSG